MRRAARAGRVGLPLTLPVTTARCDVRVPLTARAELRERELLDVRQLCVGRPSRRRKSARTWNAGERSLRAATSFCCTSLKKRTTTAALRRVGVPRRGPGRRRRGRCRRQPRRAQTIRAPCLWHARPSRTLSTVADGCGYALPRATKEHRGDGDPEPRDGQERRRRSAGMGSRWSQRAIVRVPSSALRKPTSVVIAGADRRVAGPAAA